MKRGGCIGGTGLDVGLSALGIGMKSMAHGLTPSGENSSFGVVDSGRKFKGDEYYELHDKSSGERFQHLQPY